MLKLKQETVLNLFLATDQIHTERMILRKLTRKDAEDMYEYAKNPVVTRYLTWDAHPSLDYTRNYLKYLEKQYREKQFHDFALVLRENGKMIGTVGFTRFDHAARSAEVGYVLNPDYWGRGLAVEALWAIIRFGFDELGLNRIEAKYMVENTRSRRVMEKCGMSFEGVARESLRVRNQYVSVGTCAILKSEYLRCSPKNSPLYVQSKKHIYEEQK